MTFNDILHKFRSESFTQKDKGTQFERLMRSWLLSDPRYSNLTKVWLWDDFPSRADLGGKDTGIDLVARTEEGDYWAIQCKCYKEDSVIDKPAVDSFLATSSRQFKDPETLQTTSFAKRMWISTTNHWGKNAEDAIQNQNPPFNRVGLVDLQNSPVDWQLLIDGLKGKEAMLPGKQPREHQLRAMSAAHAYFQEHDRGKLIMACGTGKTYTALKIAEDLLNNKGLVLFMVPSISLLGQSLNAWCADAVNPIKGICICSDSRASRKIKKDFDDTQDSVVDLAVPATTNPKSIAKQLKLYRNHNGLTVVFSTYQSIEAIHAAQHEILKETAGTYGKFDLIVCDEAHRTTGVKLSDRDESNFTKIHDAEYIKGNKRLYMTATPRLYGQSAKIKASEKDAILCSMDDPKLYGEEFFRVNFSYAVEHGLLTDYKVLVLTVNEDDLPDNILSDIKDPNNVELNFDDTSKLIGIVNGLSKIIRGDKHATWDADPTVMHRAIAFCSAIGNNHSPGTSVNTAEVLPTICEKYRDSISTEEREHVVEVQARHIDGSMNSQARNEQLAWLADENIGENECRVLTNVRCLSEGIDVPALDAVLFLSSRNSQVDVVQSVGRVMRNFRKGQPDEKKYGYIIIPIVVPSDVKPEDALNNNTYFSTVWSILNALRSHDDHFNAEVNKIALNKNRTSKVVVGGPGIGHNAISDKQDQQDAQHIEDAEVARQLQLRFGEMQSGIYAKLVEKCGDRLYWENWSKKVGLIAKKFIERISKLVSTVPAIKSEFDIFVKGLQNNLNPSVDEGQAIEMLAQHLISQPVFDALFADYNFVNNNAVSHSMHKMIEQLETVGGFEKDTTELESFYESVRVNVGNIDNLEGKQTIIKNLYEKFFKGAFPLTVEKLGIVYTPVECVDFIIHSVNDILKREFNTSLSDENVHILDPFTGTGTFITRLLQSGLIKPEDMERKYRNEIHCNEIVLLAYYIADVNIEAVYHDLMKPDHYVNYDGICLTDTFQLAETKQQSLSQEFFKENSEGVLRQKKAPIRVIIGNPPYSIGQKSANDNAANMTYPVLDKRVSDTYAAKSIIVRGGGGGIEKLDDLKVLAAIIELKTPIIGAIGHVEEKLFIKQLVDKCAPTPNGLGQYFSEMVESANEKKTHSRAILTEQIKKQFKEQIDAGHKQNKELQEKLRVLTENQKKATEAQEIATKKHNEQVEAANKLNKELQDKLRVLTENQKKADEEQQIANKKHIEQIEAAQKQNQSLQEQLKTLNESQKKLQIIHQKQQEDLGKNLTKMQDANTLLQKSLEKATMQNAETLKELNHAKEQAKELEHSMSELKSKKGTNIWMWIAISAILILLCMLVL